MMVINRIIRAAGGQHIRVLAIEPGRVAVLASDTPVVLDDAARNALCAALAEVPAADPFEATRRALRGRPTREGLCNAV